MSDLQRRLEWPLKQMMTCLIDNPDFTGVIHTQFYSGGVTECVIDNGKPVNNTGIFTSVIDNPDFTGKVTINIEKGKVIREDVSKRVKR